MQQSSTSRSASVVAGSAQPPFAEFTTALDFVTDGILTCARAGRLAALEVVSAVRRWDLRRQTIRTLLELDDHILKDVGLSRSTVLAAVRDQKEAMRRGWF
jgi:uncharacterized protein YjiS (DUF1127 family)